MLIPAFLGGKLLLYWAAFAWVSTWERPNGPRRAIRSLGAGAAREALGFLFGIPLILMFTLQDKVAVTVAFSVARFASWLGVTMALFPRVGWTRGILFSAGATAGNWALDFILFQGHWADIKFGLC